MISWMQRHRKYLVITIWISTIAFIAAGSLGWGAYSGGSGKSDVIAKVGSVEITNSQFQSTYSRVYDYYNQLFNGGLTKEKAKSLKLQEISLEQLINNALLLNYAKDLGMSVSDEEVVDQLLSIEAFYKDGNFSKKQYQRVLKNISTSESEFESGIRKDILREKLLTALELPITNLELKLIYSSKYIQDRVKIKLIDTKDLTIDLKESEIREYWQKNKSKYKSEKSYEIDLIRVDADSIVVSQSDIKKFYEDKPYLFKDKDGKILKFEDAKKRVKKSAQMKKAKSEILKRYLKFKNREIEPQESLSLTRSSSSIPMQKIKSAKIGEYIRSIELEDGYICLYVRDIKNPTVLDFKDAKKRVETDLKVVKKDHKLKELAIESLEDLNSAKDIGFISRDEFQKLDMLSQDEAIEFINNLFSSYDKKGYHIFEDKIVLYEIIDQLIFDQHKFQELKRELADSAQIIKQRAIESGVIKQLESMYEIVKYYRVKG
jgi:peptidyl-prolyl cis-trans isomerase D